MTTMYCLSPACSAGCSSAAIRLSSPADLCPPADEHPRPRLYPRRCTEGAQDCDPTQSACCATMRPVLLRVDPLCSQAHQAMVHPGLCPDFPDNRHLLRCAGLGSHLLVKRGALPCRLRHPNDTLPRRATGRSMVGNGRASPQYLCPTQRAGNPKMRQLPRGRVQTAAHAGGADGPQSLTPEVHCLPPLSSVGGRAACLSRWKDLRPPRGLG